LSSPNSSIASSSPGAPGTLRVFEVLPLNRPKRPELLGQRLHQLNGDAARTFPNIEAEIADQIQRVQHTLTENESRLGESEIAHELEKLEKRLSVRQFIDQISRVVRELTLRAANHRMAEGIALHRFHETFQGHALVSGSFFSSPGRQTPARPTPLSSI
jgi:hypothetical protein